MDTNKNLNTRKQNQTQTHSRIYWLTDDCVCCCGAGCRVQLQEPVEDRQEEGVHYGGRRSWGQ